VTSKPDFKVMVLLLVFMQLTRDLFAIAKFLFPMGELRKLYQTPMKMRRARGYLLPILRFRL